MGRRKKTGGSFTQGRVSEAAKELHRAECNFLATIFWGWAVKFQTYICQRDYRIEVLMPDYHKKSGSWYLRHIDPNLRNIFLADPVPINWLGLEWGKTHLLVGGTIRQILAWIYSQWPLIKPHIRPQLRRLMIEWKYDHHHHHSFLPPLARCIQGPSWHTNAGIVVAQLCFLYPVNMLLVIIPL